ncbi:MAG: hypothetical protein ICV66_01440 [Chitinophagaceae bacterium]|nr:hypothetical protein [Chitinophagaceae bacterium]
MKKNFFSLLTAACTFSLLACNNNGNNTAANDSTAKDTTTTATTATTATNTRDYAALADTLRVNSEQGNYLNPRTGKPIRIKYDPEKRWIYNEETGDPVWRYVDRRTWWVYGGENWDTIGQARMQNNRLVYRNDDDTTWVTYEQRWRDEDMRLQNDWKQKFGDTKIKVSKDGDIKVKDKSTGEKAKFDADDDKVKTDSTK